MRSFKPKGILLLTVGLIAGCATGGISSRTTRVELPHIFEAGQLEVHVNSIERSRTFRWPDGVLPAAIDGSGDTWVVAYVSVYEKKGRVRKIRWDRYVRLFTKLNKRIEPAGVFPKESERIEPREGHSLRIYYKLKYQDFPIRLKLLDRTVVEKPFFK